MKKRVLATILTVCLLFSAMACVASAEASILVGDIDVSKRICPGDYIDFDFMAKPEIKGVDIFAEGWEIKTYGADWVPYTGEPVSEYAGTFSIRYFVADSQGSYFYSNECVVTAKHNPKGNYEYDGTSHWRVCADCDKPAGKEAHTHLGSDADAAEDICQVCGHKRTPQWTGFLAFFDWIMAVVQMFLNL